MEKIEDWLKTLPQTDDCSFSIPESDNWISIMECKLEKLNPSILDYINSKEFEEVLTNTLKQLKNNGTPTRN